MTRLCHLRSLHLVTYENALHMQQRLVEMRQREEIPDQLLLLEHPPVITLGRGGNAANLLANPAELQARGVRFYETTRGGDITYHGPGQLVGYPILHMGEGNRDVRKYVSALEEVLIRTVAEFNIATERHASRRGVWVGNAKIAAIGVRIARWVTSHGFALNVSTSDEDFALITPCGLRGSGVTSMEQCTGVAVSTHAVRAAVARHFANVLDRELIEQPHDIGIVKVLVQAGEHVLLLRRRKAGFWQPVTGRIEPGEDPRHAASRELLEETGLSSEVSPLRMRQSFLLDPEFVPELGQPLVLAEETAFCATAPSAFKVSLDSEEHDDWGWFTFQEAYAKIRWSDDRDSLEQLQRLSAGSTAPGK